MKTLLEQVNDTYAAVGALPAQSPLFSNLTWCEMKGGPYGGVYDTSDSILSGVFGRIQAQWDAFTFTPQDFLAAENAVTVVGNYTGVNKSTGKSLDARVVHLWRIQNGALHFEQFADTKLIWDAMEE